MTKRARYNDWHTTNDVKTLNISDFEINSGKNGTQYLGRLVFKDGSAHRVAVKSFKNQKWINKVYLSYKTVIKDLAKAGAPIPKMGFVNRFDPEKNEKELVLVAQYFGSSKKRSKLEPCFLPKDIYKLESNFELTKNASVLASIFNAGYFPHADLFHFLPTKDGLLMLPIDFDNLADDKYHNRSLSRQIARYFSLEVFPDPRPKLKTMPVQQASEVATRLNLFVHTFLSKLKSTDLKEKLKNRFFQGYPYKI